MGRDFLGRRNKKKLTIHQLFEDEERQRSMAAVKRARERERRMSSSEGGGARVDEETSRATRRERGVARQGVVGDSERSALPAEDGYGAHFDRRELSLLA